MVLLIMKELYDEDFEKHAPQIKRFKQPMSFNTTSDVKKNAQILLEFINSMNEGKCKKKL